jgi:hypothetical protein
MNQANNEQSSVALNPNHGNSHVGRGGLGNAVKPNTAEAGKDQVSWVDKGKQLLFGKK